jgi:sulfonate dioxygenase
VVFLRDQDITLEQQHELAGYYGIVSKYQLRFCYAILIYALARQRPESTRPTTCDNHWAWRVGPLPLFSYALPTDSVIYRNIRAHGHFGAEYHGDHSYELNPPSYTLLRMVKTPPSGGDTIFASQTALFDKLSPTFQKTFEGLHGIHSSDVSREDNLLTDPK